MKLINCMDINSLKTFIKVAETGSFSRSAEQLNLSQPAISKRIATLEVRLDAQLFDRVGRKVHLTEAGQILLSGAKQIQLEVDRIEDVLLSHGTEINSSLTIGTTAYIASNQLSPLISVFEQSFSGVEIDLQLASTESLVERAASNMIELALCPLHRSSINALPTVLQHVELWSTDLNIVAKTDNPLASLSRVTQSELAASKAILPKHGTFARKAIDRELAFDTNKDDLSVAAEDFNTMRSLALMGMGWTYLPEYMIDPTLVKLNVPGINMKYTTTMLRRRERTMSRAAEAFLGTIVPTL